MDNTKLTFLPKLEDSIKQILNTPITDERKEVLSPLIHYIREKQAKNEAINLNFICTHNSRRSQFSQIWAKVASGYHGIKSNCFSGGIEITAFNERAVASLQRIGFRIISDNATENPKYEVFYSEMEQGIKAFSKLVEDQSNPTSNFAAIMTCDHADENCPIISGAEIRIPVRFEDPKKFDGTELEQLMYDKRSFQIATEMFYVFSKAKH
jgi:arsenate reductase